jgi:hypothetical protein
MVLGNGASLTCISRSAMLRSGKPDSAPNIAPKNPRNSKFAIESIVAPQIAAETMLHTQANGRLAESDRSDLLPKKSIKVAAISAQSTHGKDQKESKPAGSGSDPEEIPKASPASGTDGRNAHAKPRRSVKNRITRPSIAGSALSPADRDQHWQL